MKCDCLRILKKIFHILFHLPLVVLGFISVTAWSQQPLIFKGHSHNDYTRKRPLHDALHHGFFSIEVDVFYQNGKFIVAHTKAGIRSKNTLEKLYLQPLKEKIKANNDKVYAHGPMEFELMLDLKGNWTKDELDSLHRYVKKYSELFTVFNNAQKIERAVKIVLSGSGIKYSAADYNPRYFSIDGNLNDIESLLDSNFICRASANFKRTFRWRGRGNMPEQERKMLHEYVARAHAHGRKIRFWAAANKKNVWKELLDAGVDWVNADKLRKFRDFYLEYE